jgi:4-hydroxyacetophenone monooxygenase
MQSSNLPFDDRVDPPALDTGARERLAAALEHANIPTLVATLAHLTGEDRWLQPPFLPEPARGPGENDSGGLPEDVQREIREAVLELVVDLRSGRAAAAPDPSPERVVHILSSILRDDVPQEEAGLLAEELGVVSRDVPIRADGRLGSHPQGVAIIGAGISGLGLAIRLKASGIPFVILDKNESLGGTWVENVYPGCGVDSPSHLYSFSFEQRASWSRYFVRREELKTYLDDVADRHDIRSSIRFETEVLEAAWSQADEAWKIEVRRPDGQTESFEAPVLVSAVGLMSQAAYPQIEGLQDFAGPVMHTAEWDPDVDLTGKRVAVIGTGASAMQLVPAAARIAGHVTVVQRSPQWAMPFPTYQRDVPEWLPTVLHEVPHYQGWHRLRQVWNFGDRLHSGAQIDPDWPTPERSINQRNENMRKFLTRHIETTLEGRPDLIEQCIPSYPPYGKRMLLDNSWFETMRRDNVTLITDRVARVEEDGLVTGSGRHVPADVIALATGFRILEIIGTFTLRGRSGRTLRDHWGTDDARAHLGLTVPDFPNFFVLFGPNTNAGHGGSQFMSAEIQIGYVLRMLAKMEDEGITTIEPRQEAFDAYNAELDEALDRTIWKHPGMTTYYRNKAGRIVANMPWTNARYWELTREPQLDDYETTARAVAGD